MAILIGDSHILWAHRGSGVNHQFDPNDKTFKTIIVPIDIAGLWRAYQAMSGLTFIRFDFIVTSGGE